MAVSYYGLIDSQSVHLKMQNHSNYEYAWFEVDQLPKLGYDHEKVLQKTLKEVKKILLEKDILFYLFPSDFTIPELHRMYEQVLDKKIDRRNFRKNV